MRLSRLALLVTSSLPLFGAAAQAASLVPHRAVYDLALADSSELSGINGVTGRMAYDFSGDRCEGYTTNFRYVTEIATDAGARLNDQRTSTYEEGEGRDFRFFTRTYIDQNLDREIRGEARVGEGATHVEITAPEPNGFELAAARFPSQHLIEVIDRALGGEMLYETTIYDGSENGDEVMTTSVFIGRQAMLEDGDAEAGMLGELSEADRAYWPVEIAYFDLVGEGGEQLPSYRISFKLHPNGVTRDMLMDYGEFTISARMVDFELAETEAAACP